MKQKSISGNNPKQPPNVATYTIGTQGLVPNITRWAPTKPQGKGNANNAETNLFFLGLSVDGASTGVAHSRDVLCAHSVSVLQGVAVLNATVSFMIEQLVVSVVVALAF